MKRFIDLNGNCIPLNKCLTTTTPLPHTQRPSLKVANRCCTLLVDRMTVTLNPCKQLWLSDSEHLSASAHLARIVTVLDNPRSPRRPLYSLEQSVPCFLQFHLQGTYGHQRKYLFSSLPESGALSPRHVALSNPHHDRILWLAYYQ